MRPICPRNRAGHRLEVGLSTKNHRCRGMQRGAVPPLRRRFSCTKTHLATHFLKAFQSPLERLRTRSRRECISALFPTSADAFAGPDFHPLTLPFASALSPVVSMNRSCASSLALERTVFPCCLCVLTVPFRERKKNDSVPTERKREHHAPEPRASCQGNGKKQERNFKCATFRKT